MLSILFSSLFFRLRIRMDAWIRMTWGKKTKKKKKQKDIHALLKATFAKKSLAHNFLVLYKALVLKSQP